MITVNMHHSSKSTRENSPEAALVFPSKLKVFLGILWLFPN